MELLMIIGRTALMYVVVFLVMRLMGKREIGKLSVFDLVISIMIAEIAVFVLEDTGKPLLEGLVPIATLVLIQVALAYVALKSQKIRDWIDGAPSYLIRHGKLDAKEMKKQRYNIDDLLLQLREKQVTDIAKVEFAILETNGHLTVVEKTAEQQISANRKLLESPLRFEGLPLPLIMDGKVQDVNLEKLGKTRFWLKNVLQKEGVSDFKQIFFCTINDRGRIYIDRKRN